MKILLVDDHALFRAGLRMLLQSMRPALAVFEAGSIDEALGVANNETDLRLCLLDIHLAASNGLSAIQALKQAAPQVAVVVVSADEQWQAVLDSLDAGAMGFIPKKSGPGDLALALGKTLRGEVYLPADLAAGAASASAKSGRQQPDAGRQLSKRQWDVFHCLIRGLPNKLICRELDLSDNTIKSHVHAIFRTFEVHTRTQLLLAASKMAHLPIQPEPQRSRP
jgi:DNA-binding NarL/FixJ family response regulator